MIYILNVLVEGLIRSFDWKAFRLKAHRYLNKYFFLGTRHIIVNPKQVVYGVL